MVFETTVIKDGEEPGMPSVRTIAHVAVFMGLGVGVIGNYASVRIPHPPPIVRRLLNVARVFELAQSAIERLKDGDEQGKLEGSGEPVRVAEVMGVDMDIHACDGDVHVLLGGFVDQIYLLPEMAIEVADGLKAAASEALLIQESQAASKH